MDRKTVKTSSVCIYDSRYILLDLEKLADQNQLKIFLFIVENGGVNFEHANFIQLYLNLIIITFRPDFRTKVLER